MVSIGHIESPAFLVDVLADGRFIYRDGNQSLSDRTGLGRRLIKGRSPQELLPEPLASAVVAHYAACARSVAVMAFEEQFECEGKSSHWRTTLVPMPDARTGAVTTLLGILTEITTTKRAELALLRANAQLSLALQAVQGAHWQYDIHHHRFEASPSLALLLGEATPRPVSLDEWISRIPASDRPGASFHALIDGTSEEQLTRFRILTRAGDERWLKCRRQAVQGAGQTAQIVFGVTVDITDEVREERRLMLEAQHDGLTRLLNRRGFLGRLEAMVEECELDGSALSVLMLDLDRFKPVNDSFGHAAGDAVLAAVGQRMEGILRPGDCAARLGGDEFVVAVQGRDPLRTEQLIERLRQRIERPCPFRTELIPIAVSIGTATWEQGQTVADIMERADRALYAEKRHKRAMVRRVEPLVLRRRA